METRPISLQTHINIYYNRYLVCQAHQQHPTAPNEHCRLLMEQCWHVWQPSESKLMSMMLTMKNKENAKEFYFFAAGNSSAVRPIFHRHVDVTAASKCTQRGHWPLSSTPFIILKHKNTLKSTILIDKTAYFRFARAHQTQRWIAVDAQQTGSVWIGHGVELGYADVFFLQVGGHLRKDWHQLFAEFTPRRIQFHQPCGVWTCYTVNERKQNWILQNWIFQKIKSIWYHQSKLILHFDQSIQRHRAHQRRRQVQLEAIQPAQVVLWKNWKKWKLNN